MRVQAFFSILYREFSCERGHLGLLLIKKLEATAKEVHSTQAIPTARMKE